MSIAIITGASSGIGKEMAILLSQNGYKIVIIARSGDKLKKIADKINSGSGSCIPYVVDLANPEEIMQLQEKITQLGPISILVNNAGMGIFSPIESLDIKEWDQQLDVNLRAAFLLSQAIIPGMKKEKKGVLVYMNSIAGRQPFINSSAYVASKFALRGFANSLREELREHNIKVISVYPGAIDTPFWDKMDNGFNRKEMLNSIDCAKMIINNIQAPGNITIEEMVIRRIAGDF